MRLIPLAYLASYLLSVLGNSIAGIALPLIVLQTTGSVLGAGTVAAATAIPAVLAGLLMGVVIDRINRRTSSVVTDLVSACSIAALPVVDLISGLSLGWFILFGIIGSLGDVPGMTAREAILPAIVRHGGIAAERLIGIREALGAGALLLGPAAAGTLMVLFDGSTVLWITAATSLAAALITLLIPRSVGVIPAADRAATDRAATGGAAPGGAATGGTTGTGWSELRDGWRALFSSRFLVASTTLSVASVIVLSALQGLILPVYVTTIEQQGLLGFVVSALAVGLLVGSAAFALMGAAGSRRAWFVAGVLGTTLGFILVASLSSMWLVFVGAFTLGLSTGVVASVIGVLMVERIPEHMRGRIMGTQNAIMTAAPAVGIMAAALLTEYVGLRTAALTLAGVWLVAGVAGLAARSLRTLEPAAEQTNDRVSVNDHA